VIVLASASPRRTAILSQLGIAHEVRPAGITEREDGRPVEVASANARAKALAVAQPTETVLGCDTVVALGDRILPKPHDQREARRWLGLLSGRTHEVLGGLTLLRDGGEHGGVATTRVTFRELDARTADWYLATGEWEGKAGGYAIQGMGAALVEAIHGDYLNVVGLPVSLLMELAPELLGRTHGV
jgi:septum formation protein